MASRKDTGEFKSIRVWEFSPTPIVTPTGFKAGTVQTIEFDCKGGRVQFIDPGVFASLGNVEAQPNPGNHWFPYQAPKGAPDLSLATTAWLLLCTDHVPASWVAYDDLSSIGFDYWHSLQPIHEGDDPYDVMPPTWAGGNGSTPAGPKTPEPINPW